jgi:dienelactone hydrolase
MTSLKRSDGTHEHAFDPDRIDQLLADMEKELDKMPSDIPATEELRQEIETFRAMVESLHANHGWHGEENRSARAAVQAIAQRLTDRFS